MTLIDTVTPDSFYNSGEHFWFYMLIATFACVLIDSSPLQKHPLCDLNLLLASLISTVAPVLATNLVVIPSAAVELTVGVTATLLLSLMTTLTLQRIINVDVSF